MATVSYTPDDTDETTSYTAADLEAGNWTFKEGTFSVFMNEPEDVQKVLPALKEELNWEPDDVSGTMITGTMSPATLIWLLKREEASNAEAKMFSVIFEPAPGGDTVPQDVQDFRTSFASAWVNDDLYQAARDGNLAKLEDCLDTGADVNYIDGPDSHDGMELVNGQWGLSCLRVAAMHGHVEVVRRLIEKGAKVEAVNDQGAWAGKTALDLARANGRDEVAEVLQTALQRED